MQKLKLTGILYSNLEELSVPILERYYHNPLKFLPVVLIENEGNFELPNYIVGIPDNTKLENNKIKVSAIKPLSLNNILAKQVDDILYTNDFPEGEIQTYEIVYGE